MRRLRLLLIPLSFLLFTLLLGAAVLIGRATPTTVLALDLADDEGQDTIKYGMFDVNRRFLLRDSVTLPNVRESQFYHDKIRVLQRVERDAFSDWTLRDIDIRTSAVTTLMNITSRLNDRVRLFDLYELDSDDPLRPGTGGGRLRVYLNPTGEIYETDGISPEARLVATIDSNLSFIYWLKGYQRALAVSSESFVAFDLDNMERIERVQGDFSSAYPIISWDEKYVVFMTFTSGPDETIDVYDVETLEVIAEFAGYSPSWCGAELFYYTADGLGAVTLHAVDLATAIEETTVLSDLPQGLQDGLLSPFDPACSWFAAQTFPEGRTWLMHRPSASLFDVGIVRQMPEVAGDSMTYRVMAGEMMQLWRIAPREDGTLAPELLEEHRSIGIDVAYIDGDWRGLYMHMGRLLWVDMIAGAETELLGGDVRAFSVLD